MLSADPSSLLECQAVLSKGLPLPLHDARTGLHCYQGRRGMYKALRSPTPLVFSLMLFPSWSPYLMWRAPSGHCSMVGNAKRLAASVLCLFLICQGPALPYPLPPPSRGPSSVVFWLPSLSSPYSHQHWHQKEHSNGVKWQSKLLISAVIGDFSEAKIPGAEWGSLSSWIQI